MGMMDADAARKQGDKRAVQWLAVVAVLLLFGGLWVSRISSGSTGAVAAPAVVAWMPAGFTSTDEPNIAIKWLSPGQFACELASTCWAALLVARDGCPSSLYAEVSISDDAGTAVGYTNDAVGAVAAGQQAKLIFENFETGHHATLSKVACH
jgi:hypothetical protein